MNLSSFLALSAVIAFLFGLGFLFAPQAVLGMYGVQASDGAFVHICRLLGAAHLGMGVTAWLARPADHSSFNPVLAGLAVGTLAGLCASLYRQFNGGPPTAWVNVVIYAILAAGALYFVTKREAARMQVT